MQSFGGEELYPSIEEKAANLLYFIVKNHPFVDGNKRSGAYSFIWFLRHTKVLDLTRITPPALTAITLVTAQRKTEVISAEWSEIDFTTNVWTIPADKVKNKSAHRVPLSKLVLELLA